MPECSAEILGELRLQEQRGTVSCATMDGAPVYAFEAGPKTDTVGKAALILPFDAMGAGQRLSVEADLYLPADTPANSILIFDAECKRCGIPGNPGLRVYFRDGGLRVDRSKIGERHAWAMEAPPIVPHAQWVTVRWSLLLSDKDDGRSELALNGAPFLTNTGRTLPVGGDRTAVDRMQVGLTANSNPDPATLYMRNIRLEFD